MIRKITLCDQQSAGKTFTPVHLRERDQQTQQLRKDDFFFYKIKWHGN